MSYSKQREAILQAVLAKKCHPSADEVYARLKKEYPALSLGTVYRNLNHLTRAGQICRLAIPGSPDRYDGTLAPHCHLQCIRCGALVDVATPDCLREPEAAVEPPPGCTIEGAHLLFYGRCSHCAQADDVKSDSERRSKQ